MTTNNLVSSLRSRLSPAQWGTNFNSYYLSGKTKVILTIAFPLLLIVAYQVRKKLCASRVTPLPSQIILPIQTVHAQISSLIQQIEQEITQEGIYRESGSRVDNSSRLRALQAEPNAPLSFSSSGVKHKAAFVKTLLRALEPRLLEPLRKSFLSEDFKSVSGLQDSLRRHIQGDQFNLLKMVILHLANVAQNSAINLMTSKNLATRIGPSFFAEQFQSSNPAQAAEESKNLNEAVAYLIEHPEVFNPPGAAN